ncbi:MAG: diguanylate cyclase with sensor, partial [Actinotalea sp.]|nr:diguanylate cyclase with sensor [Actinotalea sp.]
MNRHQEPRETSGATTTLLLRHVRAAGGESAVHAVVARADVAQSPAELEDAAAWVGYDTRIRLFEAATEVLGDPDLLFAVGAGALVHGPEEFLPLALRALGTPREVFTRIPGATARLTTTSTMALLAVSGTSATLEYQLDEGYAPSRLDCRYVQGLLASVPGLFGLPLATVDHPACQSDGAPACVYEIAWRRYRRRPAKVSTVEVATHEHAAGAPDRHASQQLVELQHAAADLVSSDDVEEVLRRIADRATAAVDAQAYLLVTVAADGGEPVIRSRGLAPGRAEALAVRVGAGQPLGGSALLVDVASTRGRHGRLATIYDDGRGPGPGDRSLLEAYASHAAAALDLVMAVEDSRREESRARALLTLAHELAGARDAAAVATVVCEAIPRITGCTMAAFMLWDPSVGAMRAIATAGHSPEAAAQLMATPIRADETPEMVLMLAHHETVMVEARSSSAEVRALLEASGVESSMGVPLLAGDVLMGITTASWAKSIAGTPAHAEALTRLHGVSDQAATALENARLLGTVRHQSQHDSLTGLPNRVLFARSLDEALRAAPAGSGTAVLFCDLDRFKQVNDRYGHAAGDELLRQAGARIRAELRPSDLVGRLGGDEFGVVLSGLDDERQPVRVAERLVEHLDEPFRIGGHEVRITASVGVALHTGPDGRGERVLAAADSAMYIAKQRGRSQVVVAGAMLARRVVPSLEAELGAAVDGSQLRLFYQPLVDISGPDGGRVIGAEALLRWAHPRLGLLSPGAFLPLAEETGLITELDLWAVEAACAELAGWTDSGTRLHIAVNLSSATLVDPRLLPTVRGSLTRWSLDPDRLHLEVVESRSLIDLPAVIDRLVELRQMGVRISLDDFGTGYSTLSWLQALPVDQIKIDRSFIMRLPGHSESLAVVRGVLALARELKIEVIAEGVEEPAQL